MSCSGKGHKPAPGDPWTPLEDNYSSPTYQQPNECTEGYLARAGNAEVDNTGGAQEKGKISTVSIPVQSDLGVSTKMAATANSPAVTSWSAAPLPPGISFNTSSGTFSGTITLEGKYALTVTANFSDGSSDSKSYQLVAKKFSEDETIKFIHPMPGSIVTAKATASVDGTKIWDDPKRGRPHKGIDLAYGDGSLGNVRAAATGEVIRAVGDGSAQGYGNVVYIGHSTSSGKKVCITVYGHLSKVFVSVGQKVSSGDLIGVEGNTGHSSGAHLHFEIRSPEFSSGGGTNQVAAVYDPLAYIGGEMKIDEGSARQALDSGGTPNPGKANPANAVTQTNNPKVGLTPANAENKCSGYQEEQGNPGPSPNPVAPYNTNPTASDDCLRDGMEFMLKQEVGPWFKSNDPEVIAGNIGSYTQRKKCGYVTDTGGETKYGISKNANPSTNITTLDLAGAVSIYQSKYWNANNCGALTYPLCVVHFDTCVNTGPGRAKEFLKGLGSPSTKQEAKDASLRYLNSRLNFYEQLAASNQAKYGKYLGGWKTRVERLRNFVLST